MYEGDVILCGSSAYTRKYYLSSDFEALPEEVKKELQVTCVLFTEDVGGTITFLFNEDGELEIRTEADEEDILYDEIGSVLKVKQIQREQKELLEALETYYKVFFE
jgi:hypothetical protein